jgi:hypothetical protein
LLHLRDAQVERLIAAAQPQLFLKLGKTRLPVK